MINGISGVDFQDGDRSGSSVSAGDFNADGIDDLIIGAYLASPDGRTSAGQSYVVYGRDTDQAGVSFGPSLELSALDGSTGFAINGIDESDPFSGATTPASRCRGPAMSTVTALTMSSWARFTPTRAAKRRGRDLCRLRLQFRRQRRQSGADRQRTRQRQRRRRRYADNRRRRRRLDEGCHHQRRPGRGDLHL